jgi:hypothetical protein
VQSLLDDLEKGDDHITIAELTSVSGEEESKEPTARQGQFLA